MSYQTDRMPLSIAFTTYNQANYVVQAIESALIQQTTFDYEIVIGEDASNDGTREVVSNYASRYPSKIRVIYNGRNLGMHHNFLNVLSNTRGEYIALLEGDDYWIDCYKLQKQVEFLDNNRDYSLCGHNCIMYDEIINEQSILFDGHTDDQTLYTKDLLPYNKIPTASMVFRNGLITTWPAVFRKLRFDDWPLQIMLSQYGKVKLLSKPMSVYRIHTGGVWSGGYSSYVANQRLTSTAGWEQIAVFWEVINEYLNYEYDDYVKSLYPVDSEINTGS